MLLTNLQVFFNLNIVFKDVYGSAKMLSDYLHAVFDKLHKMMNRSDLKPGNHNR